MTKQEGSATYSKREVSLLLHYVQKHAPIGANNWTTVEESYNRRAKAESFVARKAVNLKKKFDKLVATKKPTGDPTCPPHVKLAKRIHHQILNNNAVGSTEDDEDEDIDGVVEGEYDLDDLEDEDDDDSDLDDGGVVSESDPEAGTDVEADANAEDGVEDGNAGAEADDDESPAGPAGLETSALSEISPIPSTTTAPSAPLPVPSHAPTGKRAASSALAPPPSSTSKRARPASAARPPSHDSPASSAVLGSTQPSASSSPVLNTSPIKPASASSSLAPNTSPIKSIAKPLSKSSPAKATSPPKPPNTTGSPLKPSRPTKAPPATASPAASTSQRRLMQVLSSAAESFVSSPAPAPDSSHDSGQLSQLAMLQANQSSQLASLTAQVSSLQLDVFRLQQAFAPFASAASASSTQTFASAYVPDPFGGPSNLSFLPPS
ncbi:hypothetical protein A4X09_0g7595 [Tilletia walkeri]|uniref:DUF6818 domain-containing protein n=1 Tax=Tilletia walkeri TaxID=117179 RepID=A0A8X7N1L7_9BASI|nr:hypothetical protein A4X09_0g7595 [Tilletia walkeri]